MTCSVRRASLRSSEVFRAMSSSACRVTRRFRRSFSRASRTDSTASVSVPSKSSRFHGLGIRRKMPTSKASTAMSKSWCAVMSTRSAPGATRFAAAKNSRPVISGIRKSLHTTSTASGPFTGCAVSHASASPGVAKVIGSNPEMETIRRKAFKTNGSSST